VYLAILENHVGVVHGREGSVPDRILRVFALGPDQLPRCPLSVGVEKGPGGVRVADFAEKDELAARTVGAERPVRMFRKLLLFFPLWHQVRRRLLGMGRVEFEELRPGGSARRLAPGGHEGSQRGIGRHHQSAGVAGRQGARLAGAVLLVALAQFPALCAPLVQGPAGVVQGRRLRHGFKGADKKPVAHAHHLRTARTPKHPRAVIGRLVGG